jgi:capsular polysaccharide export protein
MRSADCRGLWHGLVEAARNCAVSLASGAAFGLCAAACTRLGHRAQGGGSLAVWPSRVSPQLIAEADAAGVPLVRVEDGFVRSVGLGVDLVPPSSVVVDASGIHFDPRGASDLETLLAHGDMPASLLARAAALRAAIVAAGISKYAADTGASVPERRAGKRLVLVPGQVEDDMSVRAGGGGLTSNLELVRRARALEPEAEIWFRPHPDVDAGHRKGKVPDAAILAYADRIVRGGGMAPLLDAVDAVHVLTSLTGFEALMRGREVVCHGTPFYAGWGLTRDLGPVPARRGRMLCLDALVAGVLICYPRYLDPVTGLPCPPEVLIARMVGARSDAASINRLAWVAPLRRWQGKLMKLFR